MTTTQLAAPPIRPAHPGSGERTAIPAIAFVGTGRMGGPMAANLARAGFTVRAWDRTASHAAALTSPRRPGPTAGPRWPGPDHPRRAHYPEGDRLGL